MGEPCSKEDDLGEGKGHNELERAETKLITALEATNQALMTELEEARANNRLSTGALCSMRRALSVKEQELLTLNSEVEKLRRDLKDRMTQIQAMSHRFSSMRDGRSRDEVIRTLERDNYSLQQLVSRLQAELCECEESVSRLTLRVQARELEVLQERMQRRRLAKEMQEQQDTLVELQASRTTTQAALEQTTSKYERLRMKVIQAVYSAAGTRAPQKELTDAAIYYTMQKIIEDRSKFYQRLIQRGEKVPSLAISEAPAIRSGSVSMGRRTSVVLGT
ncbi:coiled-coil domain-containing protein 27-like [Engraulis encrasicolus]|uniref:coiled-coil domain-containing protein 27-like n=1 Tax=Engraulis encrasicolus TaxID=184585 RepID=UPI002FD556DE